MGAYMKDFKIRQLVGITSSEALALVAEDVSALRDLLMRAAEDGGCEQLAERTGIPAERIEQWVADARLCGVKGVGPNYAALLRLAGIADAAALSALDAAELRFRLLEVNMTAPSPCRQIPNTRRLEHWISMARDLAPSAAPRAQWP